MSNEATTGGYKKAGPFTAACHCGRISLTIPSKPAKINECRCSVCYKYGALWGYFIRNTVTIEEKGGNTRVKYIREDLDDQEGGPGLSFNRCSKCGTMTDWTGIGEKDGGHDKMGVNMRIFGEDENVLGRVPREVNYC